MVIGIILAVFVFLLLSGLIFMLFLFAFIDIYDDVMRVVDDMKKRRSERKHTEFQKNSEKEVE